MLIPQFVQTVVWTGATAITRNIVINGVVSGNALVMGFFSSGAGTTISSITDNQGGNWVRVAPRFFNLPSGGNEIWVAYNHPGGNTTVTIVFSGSVFSNGRINEYARLGRFSQTVAGAIGASTANVVSNNLTTTKSREFLVTYQNDSAGGLTLTGGPGWNVRGANTTFICDKLVGLGTFNFTGTLSAAPLEWSVRLISFDLLEDYTVLLSAGPAHTLTQNVVYTLPASACRVASVAAVEVSHDGTNWVALTGANAGTGVETSSQFIRCTTADTVVSIKKL